MNAQPISRPARLLYLLLLAASLQSCYHYRVLNTNNDPSTEYKHKVLWSYAWGLVNKPGNFQVPNCSTGNALDEVVYSKNFGQSLLTVITLGIVSPVEVKWKCHKPCQRVGNL
ncbi:MAG: hypothetical protein JST39_07135 [Bacteroidetes bacterium]|nr:hypothetical protein [Bacteroidota bacterium]